MADNESQESDANETEVPVTGEPQSSVSTEPKNVNASELNVQRKTTRERKLALKTRENKV